MVNFTVIRKSGKTEFHQNETYFSILSYIHTEYRSAGGNWDFPNMLLMDGKVVVPDNLDKIAVAYGERNSDLHAKVRQTLSDEFTPDWLKDDTSNGT